MDTIVGKLRVASDAVHFIDEYFRHLAELVGRVNRRDVSRAIDEIMETSRNGGSASTASHFINDLMHGVRKGATGVGIRAIALTDNIPMVTAVANDECYDNTFLRQVEILFRPCDTLLLISASGNSENLVRAANVAREAGGRVISFVGFDGGKLREMSHVAVHVPTERGEYGPVEDVHVMLVHIITMWLSEHAQGLPSGG